jgi:hypothetical protein
MAKILDETDPITVEHPVFMVYGQPGILKTSLAMTAEAPITLDFDLGAHRAIRRGKTVRIEKWADVDDLKREDVADRKTIIIDTVGRMLDKLTVDIGEKDSKKMSSGNLNQQGWGVLKTRFRNKLNEWQSWGLDVVLIAHEKEDKNGETRVLRPDMQGGSYAEVLKSADFVGYVQMVGKQRILDFSPTDSYIGKNPARWEPLVIPGVDAMDGFMARLIAMGRDALNSMSEAQREAVALQDAWRVKMTEKWLSAAHFNDGIAEIKKLPAPSDALVAVMSVKIAAAKGITFDKATKKFVDPPQNGNAAGTTADAKDKAQAPTVEEWRAKFESLTTADQFNGMIAEVKKLPPDAFGATVAKSLIDIGAAKGIVFDTTTKKFNPPVAAMPFD